MLVFPDLESLLATFLDARPELDGVTVTTDLPLNFTGATGAVLITRMGGEFRDDELIDAARIRVDAYGPAKPAAHRLALLVRGLLPLLPTTRHAEGVLVSEVVEEYGPVWFTDSRRGHIARYVTKFRVLAAVRPAS